MGKYSILVDRMNVYGDGHKPPTTFAKDKVVLVHKEHPSNTPRIYK